MLIYADPPWLYNFSRSDSRAIESKYSPLDIDSICNLPVKELADNAILYLWVTAPKLLNEAPKVIDAWGFEYVSGAVWNKKRSGRPPGMGYWWRGDHEHLLVCRRGKYSPPPASLRVSSEFNFNPETDEHSSKPKEVRQWLESWFPDEKRVELFARREYDGWNCLGNEIDGRDIRDSLPGLIGKFNNV